MVITYHGTEFFKITFGDTTLALNPVSKDSGKKSTKFGADIGLISFDHPDMNGVEQITHGERTPFVIQGPGEYEIKHIFIQGFPVSVSYDGKEGINTLYTIALEGMNLCFLGALSDKKLGSDIKGALPPIDILFIPVGGEGVLGPAEAHELSVLLEAKIVIPMHYGEAALKKFLKEEGAEQVKPLDKLTIKKKDVEGKQGEVVVLTN